MATLTSALELQDRFTKTIDSGIGAMNRMISTMDELNRAANIPNIGSSFIGIRSDAGTADIAVDRLTAAVDSLARGMEELQMSSHMNRVEQEFAGVRSEAVRTNEQLDRMNNNLQNAGNHSQTVSGITSGFSGLGRAVLVVNNGIQLMQTAMQGISQLGGQADQRIGVDARLSLINDGLQTQAGLEAKVMAAANATRTSYESTAALVAQMGRQDYFKGNNEKAIQFASTINKGFVVSGASAAEATGAITQLNQGLASGVLRGDEFNSIMENAPILAEMMTKSMGITKGQLRSMAEDGKLNTDVVVSSIMAQSQTLDQQFAKMPTTFGQASTVLGNDVSQMMDYLSQPGQAVDIIIQKLEEMTAYMNTPAGAATMQNIAMGITAAANTLTWLFSVAVDTYNFFANNWSWIGPIFLGIATAIGIAAAATLVYNAVSAVKQGIELAGAVASAIHAGTTLKEADANAAATAAQWGLNSAMLASPVTWIIAAVILLIVVIYAVVGVINQVTGSSISATGVICGAFAAAGAFIVNIFIAGYNLVLDLFVAQYNFIATFAEFFANVFNDPVGSIIRLFSGLADTVLGILKGIASAIDTLFGSHLADAVSGWQTNLQSWTDNVAGEAKIKVPRMDASAMHLQRLDYGGAYNAGYKVGQGIDSKVGGLMNSVTGLSDQLANRQLRELPERARLKTLAAPIRIPRAAQLTKWEKSVTLWIFPTRVWNI